MTARRTLSFPVRVLTAVVLTVACGVITTWLLVAAFACFFLGEEPMAVLSVAGAVATLAGFSVAWFRLLPAVRWLGLPVNAASTLLAVVLVISDVS